MHTKLGSSPAAQGGTKLVTLTFKALRAGAAKVAVTKLVTVNATGSSATVVKPGGASVGITKLATSTKVTASPAKVEDGRKVTLRVAVRAESGVAPPGKVQVKFGTKVRTVTLAAGRATVTFVAPKVRKRTVKKVVAAFLGLTNASSAVVGKVTVKKS